MHETQNSPVVSSREVRRSSGAFTLIELLTVIAIIGILAAILIPVVGKVRQTARFSTGTANIRTWTTAMVMFANENKGFLPHQGSSPADPNNALNSTANSNGVPAWYNALPAYVGSGVKTLAGLNASDLPKAGDGSIWVCPNFEANTVSRAWLSYGPSAYTSETPRATGTRYITNLNRLPEWVRTDVSRLAIFGETTNGVAGSTATSEFPTAVPNNSADSDGSWRLNRWGNEQGKANVGFADGSVRAFKSAQLRSMGGGSNSATKLKGDNPTGVIWQTR